MIHISASNATPLLTALTTPLHYPGISETMRPMLNSHNKKLAEQGRKRRAMYYRLHTRKKNPLTGVELAKRFGTSHQRMSFMLRQAKQEVK